MNHLLTMLLAAAVTVPAPAFGSGAPAEQLRRLDLQQVGEAGLQAESVLEGGAQGFGDHRGVVPQDVGVMPLPEVEDAVTVHVFQPGACRPGDAGRERLDEPKVMAAAVDQVVSGILVRAGRAGAVRRVGLS